MVQPMRSGLVFLVAFVVLGASFVQGLVMALSPSRFRKLLHNYPKSLQVTFCMSDSQTRSVGWELVVITGLMLALALRSLFHQ